MLAQCLFLYFLKMSVKKRSSNVYKEYRNETLGLNGFIKHSLVNLKHQTFSHCTKLKFSMRFLANWSHLLNNYLMENLFFLYSVPYMRRVRKFLRNFDNRF